MYRLARQRNRAGKDVEHVRVIKDENGNVMVNSEAVLKRWKEYFEKLTNEENNREPRTEEAEVVNEEVNCVSREEVKNKINQYGWLAAAVYHLSRPLIKNSICFNFYAFFKLSNRHDI